jgi:hypothetical protein
MSRLAGSIAAIAALCGSALSAAAHDRTVSYSSWEIDGARASVTASTTPLDASRLPWAAAAGADFDHRLGAYFAEHLTLRADDQPCAMTTEPMRVPAADEQRLIFRWELTCPSSRALELRSTFLLDVAPAHLHFARLHRRGQPILEHVLSDAEPSWAIGSTANTSPAAETFAHGVWLGIAHAVTGGASAFALALILGTGDPRAILRSVIGFAAVTSLALSVTALGSLRIAWPPIGVLIGLSVALVASENLWLAAGSLPVVRWAIVLALGALAIAAGQHTETSPMVSAGAALFAACYLGLAGRTADPAQLRAAPASLFGIAYGCELARPLVDASPRTPQLALVLLAFNLGIAATMLAILALQPLLRSARGAAAQAVADYGSALLLALGVFWLVSRANG